MLVRPLSTVDNTRDYARVSHSRQWSNCNIVNALYKLLTGFVFLLAIVVMCNLSTASLWLHDQ